MVCRKGADAVEEEGGGENKLGDTQLVRGGEVEEVHPSGDGADIRLEKVGGFGG